MADRRRRRKPLNNDLSDEGSDESGDEQLEKTGSDIGSEVGNSEYESADEEELAEEEERDDEEEGRDGIPPIPGEDDENKQLDDDEDRKNPQYIPKKGTFYEHDDRTAAEDIIEISKAETPEETPQPNNKKEIKKKVWKEDDRWHHDKFNEMDQSPKSRDELVEIYGYDIRNEEGPPRARRRRRYGRGPNKYTRNWEDLDAYSKPTRGRGMIGKNPRGRGSQRNVNEEEFPALSPYSTVEGDKKALINDLKQPYSEINLKLNQDPMNILNVERSSKPTVVTPPATHSHKPPEILSDSGRPQDLGRGGSHSKQRGGARGGRARGYNKSHQRDQWMNEENYSRGRGNNNDNYGRGRGSNHYSGHGGPQQTTPQYNNHQKDVDDVTMDIKSITISNSYMKEEPQFRGKNRSGGDNKKNNMVPGHLQDTPTGRGSNSADSNNVSRPKRYSSQRQRSVPDQNLPQFQHQGYYDPALEQGYQNNMYEEDETITSTGIGGTPSQLPIAGSPSFVPPAFTSPATYPPEPFLGSQSAPRMFPPVTQTPPLIMATPAVAGTPVTVPPAIAGVPPPVGPPVTGPPPFLAPENMINYVGPPPPAPTQFPGTHPPQFPPFQQFNTATQPQEIYSNGVTYYNTQSQQVVPRINVPLQKRPKAAIPIVPPPENDKNNDFRENIEIESQNLNEMQNSESLSTYDDHVSNDCSDEHSTPSSLSDGDKINSNNISPNCIEEIEDRTELQDHTEKYSSSSNLAVTPENESTLAPSSLAVS